MRRKNILSIIEEYIKDGNTLIFIALNHTIFRIFLLLTFNCKYSYNFVNPVSGAYIQNIENLWGRVKKLNMEPVKTSYIPI